MTLHVTGVAILLEFRTCMKVFVLKYWSCFGFLKFTIKIPHFIAEHCRVQKDQAA